MRFVLAVFFCLYSRLYAVCMVVDKDGPETVCRNF